MKNSENKFSVKFRGVRGSYPKANHNFLKYGGNTSCVEINVNNHLIILDAGTGIINLGKDLIKKQIMDSKEINATILLSHLHLDHIQGLPFFRPLYEKSASVNIIGSSEYSKGIDVSVSSLLFEKSFPVSMPDLPAFINFGEITESCVLVFNDDLPVPELQKIEDETDFMPVGNEVVVSCMKSNAHPKGGTMIYKIAYQGKSVVYATDKEGFIGGDKKLALFARNADLLIHDSQYTTDEYISSSVPKQGYGHSTFDMALEAFSQSRAKSLAFFHLDPDYSDEMLLEIENHYNKICGSCFIAKEGQEIVIL